MATGGYKCVQFQWTGGRTDTVIERLNFVLSGIADAIINSGTGWALDTTLTPTLSSYRELTTINSGSDCKAIVKFLVNNTANIRLALGYCSTGSAVVPNDDVFKSSTSSYMKLNGLFASVCHTFDIWEGSDAGNDVILPTNATRWISNSVYDSNSSPTFVSENSSSGYVYTYNIILKGAQLVFLSRSSNWSSGLYRGFALGEVFGNVAHPEDGYEGRKYGCFPLSELYSYESTAPETSTSYYEPNINTESQYYYSSKYVNFLRADEIDKPPVRFDTGNIVLYIRPCNTEQLSTTIASPEAGTGGRWVPLQAYLSSSDPSLYGIVSGDGFKGYLDTDFIRCVTRNTYSKGQTFGDNAEFIYLGGGIAVGWDSTNTVSLF